MKESGIYIMLLDQVRIQGMSISAVARQSGMARKTVRKYLNQGEQEHGSKGKSRGSKLDPFKPRIQKMLGMGIYNCQVILENIRKLGYDGGLSILKDYVSSYRPPAIKIGPAVKRYETEPGQQAQMDWGLMKYLDAAGQIGKKACFVMVLGKSRVRYVEFVKRCDSKSLLRCMLNGFTYFGGVPETVLTDRMKTVLISMDNGQPQWQEGFMAFASDMGFVPKVCRARRPQTKGKVERLVHYVRDNFMAGRSFVDLGDLQAQAIDWCDKVNRKVHGTTGEVPIIALREEKLKPIPLTPSVERYRWEMRKVSRDCFVCYDGTRYGLNWHYCGQDVLVRQQDGELLISTTHGEIIGRHDVCWKSGRHIASKGQYEGLTEQEGKPYQPPYGRQVPLETVEVRPLDVYSALSGGETGW